MDFNQVRYFLAVADTLNFTRASEKCSVSQPALTQAIKRLEAELGGELIHRDGRNTKLTKLGKLLRSHFEQIDHTRKLVTVTAKAVHADEDAELNIGLMCTVGPRILARVMNEFQTLNPMVSLTLHDVTPDSLPEMLLSGVLDGAFCVQRDQPHPQFRSFDLFEEPMVVAFGAGHAFSKLDTVPLQALANERYIDRLHCEFGTDVIGVSNDNGVDLNVVFRSQREDWIQSMVGDGFGVSLIPRFSVLQSELQYRPVVEPEMFRRVAFVFVEIAEITPALDKLIKHLQMQNWLNK